MITSLTWVPKGAARAKPVRFELSSAELSRVKSLAKAEQEQENIDSKREFDAESGDDEPVDAENEPDAEADADDTELPPELRMNEYDESDDEDAADMDIMDDDIAVLEQGNVAYANEEEWDAEDQEDNEIKPNDALLVVAMTEDEFSHLEVQVFSEEGNLFVHHDITLPDFPLSLAWMDCPPFQTADGSQSSVGNYIAVGTFSPAIEIWNLDVLDPLEPTAILGGENPEMQAGKKGKKSKKMSAFLPGSHEAAVMGLSWNSTYRQALASGSADTTVKIWDVTTQTCSHTFTHHTDKVQSVSWHPTEAWLLATGAFDKTIGLIDARSSTANSACAIPCDIESMTWDPFNPFHLYAALENGEIICIDVRNCATGNSNSAVSKNKAINFTFQAHDETTSGLSFSQRIPGMMATASIDKTVKVWDVSDLQSSGNGTPRCVAYKTMNVGKLFTMQFSPDDPFLLACAGDTGMVAVWESDELSFIENHFKGRVTASKSTYSALQQQNAATATAVTTQGAGDFSSVEMAIAEKPDESWMDSNETVDANKISKKNKKNKDKKGKN
mmetsp:Transcript_116431/g.228448  ORF Transcript_116431/g.228448 Transcript_116431/m.228448 type:complete len:557 (+) Transcript_116431:33-1703(+)|eukprot:CAMPEP_0170404204 /NCGR_PEP_ID=MMETSP0117_2-20130122/26507_1 /TAXON_ID=400756 /ORGANISM="Durinskia baltica, Strain CSIRO CS-38" /LENGTH=556 /DNA_ID=CAMNT_0010661205 /DNA_START=33 /DNA_END=1703 /DNA_ORIENTATION=-